MTTRGQRHHFSPGDSSLLKLAGLFAKDSEVIALATFLLEKVGPGGRSFVESLPDQSSTMKAHAVLEEWARKKPGEAFSDKLLAVLSEEMVNPSAALKFKTMLPASSYTSGVCSASGKRKSRDVHCDKEGQPETRTFSDVSSGSKKRKSKDVHSDKESRPKKRKSSGVSPASGKRKSKDADSAKKRESSESAAAGRTAKTEDDLLRGIETVGGRERVKGRKEDGGVHSVHVQALKILDEWSKHSSGKPHGRMLDDVI